MGRQRQRGKAVGNGRHHRRIIFEEIVAEKARRERARMSRPVRIDTRLDRLAEIAIDAHERGARSITQHDYDQAITLVAWLEDSAAA